LKKSASGFSFGDLVLFFLLGIFWGGSFIAIKILVVSIAPWFAGAARMCVAVASLAVIFRLQKHRIVLARKDRGRVWLAGLITLGLPFALLFWAEQRISAGLGGIMNGTTPLWTALLLLLLNSGGPTQKKVNLVEHLKVYGGLLLGFVGIVIIFYPQFSLGTKPDEFLGAAAVLLMAILYGVSNILNRSLMTSATKMDLRSVVYHQHMVGLIFLLVLSILFEPWPRWELLISYKVILSLLYLGVISSAIAFLVNFYLIRKIGALKVSAITYIVPVSALFFDSLLLGNRPPVSMLFGIAFILVGLFFVRSSEKTS